MGYLIEIAFTVLLLTALSDGQLQGSSCTMKNTGRAGVCTPFANCQSAKDASYKGNLPQKCDLIDDDSELVCCVAATCSPLLEGLVNQLPIGSRAADYCIELAEKIHPCQETDSGWTRGSVCPALTPDTNIEYKLTPMTTTAEAPHYGLIGSGQTDNITWEKYPVTLVSDQWVLCSAFTIGHIGSDNVQFVGLGGTITPQYNPDEIYGVTEKHKHPLYSAGYSIFYNDIALLRLDRRVTFTARIVPACLHTGTPLPDTGFIQTGSDYESSIHFKTTMKKVSQEECSSLFPTGSYEHPDGVQHDREVCSSPVNATGGCGGWYQGTPLTLPNNLRVACTHLLVGLKTYYGSPPCTTTNTRVSTFIPWIEDIVWPDTGVVV